LLTGASPRTVARKRHRAAADLCNNAIPQTLADIASHRWNTSTLLVDVFNTVALTVVAMFGHLVYWKRAEAEIALDGDVPLQVWFGSSKVGTLARSRYTQIQRLIWLDPDIVLRQWAACVWDVVQTVLAIAGLSPFVLCLIAGWTYGWSVNGLVQFLSSWPPLTLHVVLQAAIAVLQVAWMTVTVVEFLHLFRSSPRRPLPVIHDALEQRLLLEVGYDARAGFRLVGSNGEVRR
ncbi:MAG: hypothetical protein VB138_10600, partial [Burkholderia sp.]